MIELIGMLNQANECLTLDASLEDKKTEVKSILVSLYGLMEAEVPVLQSRVIEARKDYASKAQKHGRELGIPEDA